MDDRRGWLATETAQLMTVWNTAESVYAIAASLGRSRMSVLVQATRLGLPARDSQVTRRKWSPEELAALDAEYDAVRAGKKPHIDAEALVRRLGRGFDAILAKLEKRWGSDAIAYVDPDSLRRRDGGLWNQRHSRLLKTSTGLANTPFALPKQDGARERKCLSCNKMFWSEGKHNRICGACKTKPYWE